VRASGAGGVLALPLPGDRLMTDAPTIIPIRGATLVLPGEPNQPVIALLEKLIERARHGEVTALAVVVVTPAGGTTHAWEIGDTTWPPIVGAVAMLHHAMLDYYGD
jgi:hypothetical protein